MNTMNTTTSNSSTAALLSRDNMGRKGSTMQRLILPILLVLGLSVGTASAQSTSTYLPAVPSQFLDDSGNPCSKCLLYFYAAGTTTPRDTYSDNGFSNVNANPVVLDAAGRATVFLAPVSYKVVLKTAAGSTLWTRDNIASVGASALNTASINIADGRLTLTSNTPVTTADVNGATTVYYTPYKGNKIALYNTVSSAWELRTFSQLEMALPAVADTNYDVFVYLEELACPGSCSWPVTVVSLTRIAWTNATTRATALTRQDGVLVSSATPLYRYLGTVRTTSVAGQTEDSMDTRFLWNYYNRVPRAMRVLEATNTWAYSTATYRPANNSTVNSLNVVVGWEEVPIEVDVYAYAINSNATSISIAVAIGEDSTTTPATGVVGRFGSTIASSGASVPVRANLRKYPTVGWHYYMWLEYSEASGTTTWYGDNGGALLQAGIVGVIWG